MNILIIPDIHHRTSNADLMIFRNPHCEKIIFLGDYFDDFGDGFLSASSTAQWLAKSLTYENRIHLIGNHDLAYMYSYNPECYCSGFTREKSRVTSEVMSKLWNKLKWLHWEDDVFFGHSFFHKSFVSKISFSDLKDYLNKEAQKATACCEVLQGHFFYQAGRGRGGCADVGGLVWADFIREATDTKFWQICGHTPGHSAKIMRSKHSIEYIKDNAVDLNQKPRVVCLDSPGCYGILNTETKILTIKYLHEQ